ncbi:cobaltochelatase subunit CobN [Planktothricoides raciborskii]|uniref:Cobaltochelatase subunit CobN n=1 Tax=Planktothricoides raciborskii FACHB-1370 TaxID=2949576 RepID=A0ABR8EJ54_9CYAN|nr:cobaltochelatase subunit CobN [Planktothricoides raciborskii]MBD2546610.1 cobaltochelatase subunit CobN [Planktothricoides raciborskii FACHB-1370]MBD2585134.1 cobaltochelatase subunit CobN [Planktothricoides raciborskii FACHB-1261]
MHRLAAIPGGWNSETEGVIFVEQTPAPVVFLTAADTDIQVFSAAITQLPKDFPGLRVTNLLQLQQQLSIDTYAEEVLAKAEAIILRLLGGRAYWSYGLEVVKATVEQTGGYLIVLPGDDRPDPDLMGHSTVPLRVVNQVWRYLTEGGVENTRNALKFIADNCLGKNYQPPAPVSVPRVGRYDWLSTNPDIGFLDPRFFEKTGDLAETSETGFFQKTRFLAPFLASKIGILFYRAHYLAGNMAPIDALCAALAKRGLDPVPLFVSSLRDRDVQAEILSYFQDIQVILNTTGFAIAQESVSSSQCNSQSHSQSNDQNYTKSSNNISFWQQLDVPVLQVILSSGTEEQWRSGFQGLSPRDLAMNVALPEVDGRIISRAISFKLVQTQDNNIETPVVVYQPVRDRIEFVADLAKNWAKLRQTPPEKRRIALILANYPTRDGRLANGVGLDTPASCVEILKALQKAGYFVSDIPADGDELITRLTTGITNDPEGQTFRPVWQQLPQGEYQNYFSTLPPEVQAQISDRWQNPETILNSDIPISGIQLGNIFVGIQPSRGYDLDPSFNYHAPDLEPTHHYLGFYYWLKQHFQADAMVHIGKHGNLEWLPGKGVALSENCYPEIALGPWPNLYPFIVNDPGEGSQAKRRAQAVIIDHLTPPMTRAELYGPLLELERLIDEYYEAQNLDPKRVSIIRDRLSKLIFDQNLHQELSLSDNNNVNQSKSATKDDEITDIIANLDGYLCELKEAQIRDGLHIFGQCPQGRQLRDLIVAIARCPGVGRLGLTRALAEDLGLDFDPLTVDPAFIHPQYGHIGEAIEQLENIAAELVEQVIKNHVGANGHSPLTDSNFTLNVGAIRESPLQDNRQIKLSKIPGKSTEQELNWIRQFLFPALQETPQEISQLIHGLNGGYVPSGASGAPTRGRPEVLPTGRNFYSVDIRAIPTETAWDIGRKAADEVILRYTQENGEYPKTLGLSIWGTSTMRTGGDDIAEALALLGVRPVWDGPSRRVVDIEIIPLSVLGRPRVDVTLRISGFFRDGFPNLIDLYDRAVNAVASLEEPADQNPLAFKVQTETKIWQELGLNSEQAKARSHYRVFGSKPGAYGAGLQGLIEEQNWLTDEDLARAYINWSSYAYTGTSTGNVEGHSAPEAFNQRLKEMQIVLHNQDNREHDLLDSDDYYQFQGGLTVAVRSVTGKNPQTYFGDNSIPEKPKVRQLREEIAKVYRSRVINPKWIAGVMRHGYKGAFEIAATVDYLFAYDATANCVQDYMYEGVANAYIFDEKVQDFIQQKNPWALRDMAERLLEAKERGLWQNAPDSMISGLRNMVLEAEGIIESKSDIR